MIRVRIVIMLAVASVGVQASGNALAQGRGGGFGRGGLAGMVGIEPVQKELGVDSGVAIKLDAIANEFREESRTEFENAGLGRGSRQALEGLKGDERKAKFREQNQKRAEITRKLNEKYAPKLKAAMKPEQYERLLQIHRQAGGSPLLLEADHISALDINKEQQEKIAKLNDEYVGKQLSLMDDAFGGGGGDFQSYFAKVQDMNKERDAKAGDLLTKAQQDKYAQLKGKPFDLALLRQPRN